MATPMVNKIVTSSKRKYVLDYTSGCVLGFSLYKLTNKYKGYCLQVQRQSDNTTLDVGFVGEYVDIAAIEAFCAGTTGRIKIWYNQFAGNNATQDTFSLMPIIATNGVFEIGGIKLVSAANTYLTVADYAATEITIPPISVYSTFKFQTGVIFSNAAFGFAISISSNTVLTYINFVNRLANTYSNNTEAHTITAWNSFDVNELKNNTNGTVTEATYASAIAAFSPFYIGRQGTGYASGNIKTILVFNTNQIGNYNLISGGC